MGFLVAEIKWIQGLMANREVAEELLQQYLNTFGEAIALNLDERGRPVKDWFSQLSELTTSS
jgi:hypothetical protein